MTELDHGGIQRPAERRVPLSVVATSLVAMLLCSCEPRQIPPYVNPRLPPEQLAELIVDKRATLLAIDGLTLKPLEPRHDFYVPPATGDTPPYLGAGCHVIEVEYNEVYFGAGTECKRFMLAGIPYDTCAPFNAPKKTTEYSTLPPAKFFVRARPPSRYWITATFTGDVFMPRVVELDPAGEPTATVLPDVACP